MVVAYGVTPFEDSGRATPRRRITRQNLFDALGTAVDGSQAPYRRVGFADRGGALAAILGGAYYAARRCGLLDEQALRIEPEVLQRGSRELESRATALDSDAQQRGEWQALFTTEQINGWLATQLSEEEQSTLPTNIRDPRVAIADDMLTLGFRTKSGVSIRLSRSMRLFSSRNSARLEFASSRFGPARCRCPYLLPLADELANACKELRLPVALGLSREGPAGRGRRCAKRTGEREAAILYRCHRIAHERSGDSPETRANAAELWSANGGKSMVRLGFQAHRFSTWLCTSLCTSACKSRCGCARRRCRRGQNTIGGGTTSGVAVDADGVLRRVTAADPTGELARQRVNEALTKLDRDVAQRSPLRKVSLTRLERIMKQATRRRPRHRRCDAAPGRPHAA